MKNDTRIKVVNGTRTFKAPKIIQVESVTGSIRFRTTINMVTMERGGK